MRVERQCCWCLQMPVAIIQRLSRQRQATVTRNGTTRVIYISSGDISFAIRRHIAIGVIGLASTNGQITRCHNTGIIATVRIGQSMPVCIEAQRFTCGHAPSRTGERCSIKCYISRSLKGTVRVSHITGTQRKRL